MCRPLANMTFRRKVGATFIFIFILNWFLYYNYILPVITSGGSQGEGIEILSVVTLHNSSLLYCTFFCCLPGVLAQLSSQNFYHIIQESTSHLSLWFYSVRKVHNTHT